MTAKVATSESLPPSFLSCRYCRPAELVRFSALCFRPCHAVSPSWSLCAPPALCCRPCRAVLSPLPCCAALVELVRSPALCCRPCRAVSPLWSLCAPLRCAVAPAVLFHHCGACALPCAVFDANCVRNEGVS